MRTRVTVQHPAPRTAYPHFLGAGWMLALALALGAPAAMGQSRLPSIGAADPAQIGRNYRSLDQIYAIAPAVIQGRFALTQAQAAVVPVGTPPVQPQVVSTTLPRFIDSTRAPVIQPIERPNWVWLGTTALVSSAGLITYLVTRPE